MLHAKTQSKTDLDFGQQFIFCALYLSSIRPEARGIQRISSIRFDAICLYTVTATLILTHAIKNIR